MSELESILTKNQKKTFGPKRINWGDTAAFMSVKVRYDDDCGNGHNTFSITADVRAVDKRINHRDDNFLAGGCLHEDIAKHFPELAHLIKHHLVSSNGSMHYIANAVFLAGDKDCYGRRKGEAASFSQAVSFGKNPIKHRPGSRFIKFLRENAAAVNAGGPKFDFEVIRYDHADDTNGGYKFGPKYTFGGFAEKWHECPFDTEIEALDFLVALQTCEPSFHNVATSWNEGKERELDRARSAACWPDATDKDLTAPGLEERLQARLPGLLREFRKDVEALGFVF